MSLKTGLFTHKNCLLHNPGEGHPEKPARLAVVLDALRRVFPEGASENAQWVEASIATKEQIISAHDEAYFELIKDSCAGLKPGDAPLALDPDTNISYGSWDTVMYSVGASCAAVDAVYDGVYKNAFCVTRPPGHHAIKGAVKGFCVFGNVAIAAKHALTKPGIERVAIVDFDVHQGNGTEDLIKDDPRILFFSTHQDPLWPYMHHEDKGPHGTIHNIPVPLKMPAEEYHVLFDEQIMAKLDAYAPDFLILSTGFDAHRDDPPPQNLFNDPPGRQMLLEEDFNLITRKLMQLADRHAKGRLVSVLEGGYNVDVLANCCVEHAKTLSQRF